MVSYGFYDDGTATLLFRFHTTAIFATAIPWCNNLYFQPLSFCSRVCDYTNGFCNFVLRIIALVLEGEIWDAVLFYTSLAVLSSLFDPFFPLWLQKSGEFVVLVGLNAENEILHTLAFLAGVMIWSQVSIWILLLTLENKCVSWLHWGWKSFTWG